MKHDGIRVMAGFCLLFTCLTAIYSADPSTIFTFALLTFGLAAAGRE